MHSLWSHSGVWIHSEILSLPSGFTPESIWIHSGVGVWSSGVCSHSGVCSLELLRSLESRVTPEAVVWSLQSFRLCTLESLRSLKSRRSLESAFIPEPRIWSHFGVWSRNMESGVWIRKYLHLLESVVLIHSGFCSLEFVLRSL